MPITSVDVPKFTSNQVDLVYLEGFWPYMTIWMFNTVDEQTLVPVEIANNVYQLYSLSHQHYIFQIWKEQSQLPRIPSKLQRF